jgi:hypothetical protein
MRALVPSASFRCDPFADSPPPPCAPAAKPALLSLVIGFCSQHCEPAAVLAVGVRSLGALYDGADAPAIRTLVFQLGLALHTESPALSYRALDVVTAFAEPPSVIEAAIRYLTKFDSTRNIVSADQRCELAARLLAGGAANIVIVAAVPLLRPFASRIWEEPRVRELIARGRAKCIADRTLRLQIEFYAKEGKVDFTTADLLRYVTAQPTVRRSTTVSNASADSFERLYQSDSPECDPFELLTGDELVEGFLPWAEPLETIDEKDEE